MKLRLKIPLVFFALSGLFFWALVAPSAISIYAKHGIVRQWPPASPFFPIDGVVIEKVLLDKTDHDGFHGDGTTLRVYQVDVSNSVYKILSNNRIRGSRIWLARPFDDKTTSALAFISSWTANTQVAPFLKQIMESKDTYVTYDDLQPGTDAAIWLFSPSLKWLIFMQVNT
jgi:hypothetical protein